MSNWQEFQSPDGVPYYSNAVTGETSWDKPQELMDELERDTSDYYWVPHETEGYVFASVVAEHANGQKDVRVVDTGEDLRLKKSDQIFKTKRSLQKKIHDDLVQMDDVNVGSICQNLRLRFQQDRIYTNVGTILISVNPFKQLPLYTPTMIDKYSKKGTRELPPHAFNIADAAFRALTLKNENQSVLISGESGAGKTEAAKVLLQYLAAVAGSSSGIEQKILQANPILEGFGNAKTVRNDNSSRFGKWVEIQFNNKGQICGSKTCNYLLEKSRVIKQSPTERNYHVFYQLLKGASPDMRQRLKLKRAEDYQILNHSGCIDISGVDDQDEYEQMLSAFRCMDVGEGEQKDIFDIVGAVLQLSNLEFVTDGDIGSKITTREELETAAALLGLQVDELEKVLTTRMMVVPNQPPMTCFLDEEKAKDNSFALVKMLYGNLFNHLVNRINRAMTTDLQDPRFIGVLDIFGFEIFEKNSFEQLCINFANEKLQQHFNQNTFKLEEALYTAEQIKFTHVDFIDNQPTLDLIEMRKPLGILKLLDEEIVMPKTTDLTFLAKLNTNFDKKHPQYQVVVKTKTEFGVVHYAGVVVYDVTGFLDKNRDTLSPDLYDGIAASKSPIVQSLFPIIPAEEKKKRNSLGNQFREQLVSLMNSLNSTNPNYIRCVKSNSLKKPGVFMGSMCLEQLKYAGVFEAVHIRKSGFPFRLTHQDFYDRYRCIKDLKPVKGGEARSAAMSLLDAFKPQVSPGPDLQIGTTRVLYRAGPHRQLELMRNVEVERRSIVIQKYTRRHLVKQCLRTLQKLRGELMNAVKSRDLKTLDAVLEKASSLMFCDKHLHNARGLRFAIVEENELIGLYQQLLKRDAEESHDETGRAIVRGDAIKLKNLDLERCRERYNEIQSLLDLLREAMFAVDEALLTDAINKTSHFKVFTEEVASAVRLRDNVRRLTVEAATALDKVDKELMTRVLKEATAIGMKSDQLDEMRNLLGTTPEKFLQIQLHVALSQGDTARAIEVMIEIKDVFFGTYAFMFKLEKCPLLRTPEEYANAKWLPFGKEQLKLGMLKWDSTLPTTLTNFPDTPYGKESKKIALKMFKNVRGYMGDEKMLYPDALSDEICRNVVTYPDCKDEMYMQLIKQLTSNPDEQSKNKGWELMGRFLDSFSPSDDFSNYLEVHLRSSQRTDLIKKLHTIIFRDRPPVHSAGLSAEQQAMGMVAVDPREQFRVKRGGASATTTITPAATTPAASTPSPAVAAASTASSTPVAPAAAAQPPAPAAPAAPQPPAPAPPQQRARALFAYTSDDSSQLSFAEGDLIDVQNPDSGAGWGLGTLNGVDGFFPLGYVEMI